MPLLLEIVTPERLAYSDTVDSVNLPGIEGELGVLPHHAPLVSMLGVGELRIRKGGAEESFAIVGGFLQVRPDRVVVMAETADLASEIDLEKAQEARREAERTLEGAAPTDAVDLAAARAQLQQALLRIRVAERRHREGPRHRGQCHEYRDRRGARPAPPWHLRSVAHAPRVRSFPCSVPRWARRRRDDFADSKRSRWLTQSR